MAKQTLLSRALSCAIAAAISVSASARASADTPPDFQTVLYGAAYYHEYMPSERLDKDVVMMKAAGFNVVRVGESTWSLWEPEEGRFEYAWMDRVIDAMGKAGIKVIMGTPTYSIPAWMAKQNPEILATKLNGTKNTYGMRQNNLRTRTGINSFKRAVHYYFNYSGSEISFNYPHKPGSDLLANRVAAGEKITLAPWEVAIIEEGAK